MREVMGGFEGGSNASDRLVVLSAGLAHTTSGPRPDLFGTGSTRCVRVFAGTAAAYTPFNQPLKEFYAAMAVQGGSANDSELSSARLLVTQGSGLTLSCRVGDLAQTLRLRRASTTTSGGTLLAISGPGVWEPGRWEIVYLHVKIDPVNGFFRAYINDDGTFAVPTVEFTGNTQGFAPASATGIGFGASTSGAAFDEFAVNSITLAVDSVVGGFAEGDLITGGTSGATARVWLHPDGGSRIWLYDWNGTPFLDNEEVSDGINTANVNAPTAAYRFGLEPESGFPFPLGHMVLLKPVGAGASSQWANSAAGPPADNWSFLDEIPYNTSDFVVTSDPAHVDWYVFENPPPAALVIRAADLRAYAVRNGAGTPRLRLAAWDGSAVGEFGRETPFTSFQLIQAPVSASPYTGLALTPAEIGGWEYGLKIEV